MASGWPGPRMWEKSGGGADGVGDTRDLGQAVVLSAVGALERTEARKRGPLKCPLLLLSGT